MAYRIVRKNIKCDAYTKTDSDLMEKARKLFPVHPRISWPRREPNTLNPSQITVEDLKEAARRIKTGKAPGPDHIHPEVVRAMVKKSMFMKWSESCGCERYSLRHGRRENLR